MAKRRMFSLDVVDTDIFLDMPCSARLLYYDLGMRADDDGFLSDAKKILRFTGATKDDLNVLIARGFVIAFDTGVVVIRHWKVNNQIRKDRYLPTRCISEFGQICVEKTGIYSLTDDNSRTVANRFPDGCQTVATLEPQVRLDQGRVVEEDARATPATASEPVEAFDGSDLSGQVANLQHADGLIRRYRLPDCDASREALLEDAERVGWEKLEDALGQAAASNSRQGLSINFYRAVLNGTGREGKPDVRRSDPYGGYGAL